MKIEGEFMKKLKTKDFKELSELKRMYRTEELKLLQEKDFGWIIRRYLNVGNDNYVFYPDSLGYIFDINIKVDASDKRLMEWVFSEKEIWDRATDTVYYSFRVETQTMQDFIKLGPIAQDRFIKYIFYDYDDDDISTKIKKKYHRIDAIEYFIAQSKDAIIKQLEDGDYDKKIDEAIEAELKRLQEKTRAEED